MTAAFCRILANQGLSVAPFKSQNMSNFSYMLEDGKEISLAQAIQAEAAKVRPNVFMNPILLKPINDETAEVVLFGKNDKTLSGKDYRNQFYHIGLQAIKEALKQLQKHFSYIVIEGAGSPVEMNLYDRELVNMKVAELADVPVVLVADIDRGGVFASIYGTLALLSKEHKKRVIGIIINKFRGDASLFQSGITWIEEHTGVKVLGVVPYIGHLALEGEDSLSVNEKTGMQRKNREAQFDELAAVVEKNVDVKYLIQRMNEWGNGS